MRCYRASFSRRLILGGRGTGRRGGAQTICAFRSIFVEVSRVVVWSLSFGKQDRSRGGLLPLAVLFGYARPLPSVVNWVPPTPTPTPFLATLTAPPLTSSLHPYLPMHATILIRTSTSIFKSVKNAFGEARRQTVCKAPCCEQFLRPSPTLPRRPAPVSTLQIGLTTGRRLVWFEAWQGAHTQRHKASWTRTLFDFYFACWRKGMSPPTNNRLVWVRIVAGGGERRETVCVYGRFWRVGEAFGDVDSF